MAAYDLKSLLCSPDRDFLLRNNGDQVKVDELRGKCIGLYFSALSFGLTHHFTAKLVEDYNHLFPLGDFEVILVSSDYNEKLFTDNFSTMPWLAIPFSDKETNFKLTDLFHVLSMPQLVILNGSGEVLIENAVNIMTEYGAAVHPFTPERIEYIIQEDHKARKEQTLNTLLVSWSRDFVLTNDGNQVPVSELEGKTIGLYFFSVYDDHSLKFTKKLVEAYNMLQERGENFEVVMVPVDADEDRVQENFEKMPWLALPCMDRSLNKLLDTFKIFKFSGVPVLVIIGPDGKTLHPNAVDIVEDHGDQAFPFTPERLVELEKIMKTKLEAQTLESVLVQGERDFVIKKDGTKILVSDLAGKNILLYFSAHWCPPCITFLPKLIQVYHEIKAKDDAFEIIYVPSDYDEGPFQEFFSTMPWLALPYGDERKDSLYRKFRVSYIPVVVALGPSGRTVTTDCRRIIVTYGAEGYPFTDEHIKEVDDKIQEFAKGLPARVKHALHEKHDLVLCPTENPYRCNGCNGEGGHWSFYCKDCDFDLHPECALQERVKRVKYKGVKVEDGSEQVSKKE